MTSFTFPYLTLCLFALLRTMACKTCKTPLDSEDSHLFCLLHRKCSRDSPCQLDTGEGGEYWDQVEAIKRAVGEGHRPSLARVAKSQGGSKLGSSKGSKAVGGSSGPPPLAPFSSANLPSHLIVLSGKKKLPKQKTKDSLNPNPTSSPRHEGAPRGVEGESPLAESPSGGISESASGDALTYNKPGGGYKRGTGSKSSVSDNSDSPVRVPLASTRKELRVISSPQGRLVDDSVKGRSFEANRVSVTTELGVPSVINSIDSGVGNSIGNSRHISISEDEPIVYGSRPPTVGNFRPISTLGKGSAFSGASTFSGSGTIGCSGNSDTVTSAISGTANSVLSGTSSETSAFSGSGNVDNSGNFGCSTSAFPGAVYSGFSGDIRAGPSVSRSSETSRSFGSLSARVDNAPLWHESGAFAPATQFSGLNPMRAHEANPCGDSRPMLPTGGSSWNNFANSCMPPWMQPWGMAWPNPMGWCPTPQGVTPSRGPSPSMLTSHAVVTSQPPPSSELRDSSRMMGRPPSSGLSDPARASSSGLGRSSSSGLRASSRSSGMVHPARPSSSGLRVSPSFHAGTSRRLDADDAMSRGPARGLPLSIPLRSHHARGLPPSRHLEADDGSDSEFSDNPDGMDEEDPGSDGSSTYIGDAAALFTEPQEEQEGHEEDQEPTSQDPQLDKDAKVFTAERCNALIRRAARLADSEFVPEEEPASKLSFGRSGLTKKRTAPIIAMPPDVYTLQKNAKVYGGKIGSTPSMTGLFRVPEEDFRSLFMVPKLDGDVLDFVQLGLAAPVMGYVKSWEDSLSKVDEEVRGLTRLAAFQLMFANALGVELSDLPDGDAPDSPQAFASLLADMASRQTAMLMRLSASVSRMRQDNVFAAARGPNKKNLVEKLKELSIGDEVLFGGKGFQKTLNKAAKKIASQKEVNAKLGNARDPRRRLKAKRASRQMRAPRNHPYVGASSRGAGFSGTGGSSNRGRSAPRGRGQTRGGRQQQRGRGRGNAGKRF